ncbi:MAG: cytochrome c biogenesis protein CcdA, partial [bacterium]|nr:cytochrome c biogenesis protein CcdA [bacterium]
VVTRERRFHIPHFLALGRPESSCLIGALFALGWSPCIGPILGTILLFASTGSSALQGAVLLGIFSLGLGLPFILTALLLERASAFFARWSNVTHTLTIVGGIVLVVLGVLMLLGQMGLLVTWGFGLLDRPYSALLQYM